MVAFNTVFYEYKCLIYINIIIINSLKLFFKCLYCRLYLILEPEIPAFDLLPTTCSVLSQLCFTWRLKNDYLKELVIRPLYLTNRSNRSQMPSQCVKNKKVRHETKSSDVTVVLYTLWRLLWSITVHTHTWKNVIYLFYKIKIHMVYWRIFGAWRDLMCVCVWSRSTTNAHRSHVIV